MIKKEFNTIAFAAALAMVAIMLPSCRSSKHTFHNEHTSTTTDTTTQSGSVVSADSNFSQSSYSETNITNTETTTTTIVWSAPDSTGNQYPVSTTTSHTASTSAQVVKDSTSTNVQNSLTIDDNFSEVQTTTDNEKVEEAQANEVKTPSLWSRFKMCFGFILIAVLFALTMHYLQPITKFIVMLTRFLQ